MAPRSLPPLSRRYGFFFCNDCERGWESAQVYCIRGTKKVYFRQGCKQCKTRLFPYDNQKLRCGACGMWDCHCTEHDRKSRARHVDPKKRHPAWLCDKCKAGYPCSRDNDDYDDDYDSDCTCGDYDDSD